jgi:aminoglycoside 6-adenylyltransferase
MRPPELVLASLLKWARKDSNVIALIQTGSAARSDGRTDSFSDVDIEIIARDPQKLLLDDSWFVDLGDVWITMRFDDVRYPTRLVVYDGGAKLDYTIAGADRLTGMAGHLDPLYERGYCVLLDKEGLSTSLPAATGAFPLSAAPTQDQFNKTVEEFWFEATHMPRYLARHDLWVVKFRDWTMKEDLLEMLEWHAAISSADRVDTWHIGTRMIEWADQTTWAELDSVFGRFDQADAWRALLATTDLFARLSRETARGNGLIYPTDLENNVRRYLSSFSPSGGPTPRECKRRAA